MLQGRQQARKRRDSEEKNMKRHLLNVDEEKCIHIRVYVCARETEKRVGPKAEATAKAQTNL